MLESGKYKFKFILVKSPLLLFSLQEILFEVKVISAFLDCGIIFFLDFIKFRSISLWFKIELEILLQDSVLVYLDDWMFDLWNLNNTSISQVSTDLFVEFWTF